MDEIQINEEYLIKAETKRTRAGTREWAYLYHKGAEISKASDFWSNRHWYRFTYENAIRNCLEKKFTKEQTKAIIDGLAKKDFERVNSMFGTLSAVCKMGELITNNQKDSNDWKKRMLTAGLPGLEIPEDWETLSEDEKAKRLDAVINIAKED